MVGVQTESHLVVLCMGVAVAVYQTLLDHPYFWTAILGVGLFYYLNQSYKVSSLTQSGPNEPPFVPYTIPFLGSAVAYGIDPLKFMSDCQAKVTLIDIVW